METHIKTFINTQKTRGGTAKGLQEGKKTREGRGKREWQEGRQKAFKEEKAKERKEGRKRRAKKQEKKEEWIDEIREGMKEDGTNWKGKQEVFVAPTIK